MRLLITAAILIAQFNLFGQEIAKCIEILGTDSIKFYFKAHGILVDKECADYYRIAKMSHDGYFFDGRSLDYYLSGQLTVDSRYSNNLIHGAYNSFYLNGQAKETGQYNDGQKVGEWKYWYENGQLKKVIVFSDQGFFLKELYKSNGKQLVVDGNGEYIETDLQPGITMKGEIRNGKQHGKWTIFNQLSGFKTGVELFENGKFIEGQNIAQAASFNEKYTDYPSSFIDLTKDLLDISRARKIDCTKYGRENRYRMARYNSKYTALPFYDYVYQNFDPPKFGHGYILAGFSINPSGELTNISIHSTLPDQSVTDQLISVLRSSEKWEPETLNGEAIEIAELFVFQFYNGTYKILTDTRNDYPPVEFGAQFNNGMDGLISLIGRETPLPKRFYEKGFNLSTSIAFHVDETGNCIADNSVFLDRVKVTDDELALYNALFEMFQKMNRQWKPATYNGTPVKHFFNGVLTIRDGKQKFRLFSHNWVLK